MRIGNQGSALQDLNMLFNAGTIGGLADAQLLERFVSDRDEIAELAFRVLVERHGPMVLRVCRGVLCDEHEAHDAFQATFLVLVRRAGSLWARDSLAPWLHQVAYRTATRARSATARRRRHERRAAEMKAPPHECVDRADLGGVIHHAMGQLPERYREAIVLCLLEGLTPAQAARQLNCPVGTVHSRLARGRTMLARRLARHGFAGTSVALPLADGAASACIPCELVASTLTAAKLSVTLGAAGDALLSTKIVTLAQGVMHSMIVTKIKIATTIVLILGIAALSAGGLISRTLATEPAGGLPDLQENGQAGPDDLRGQVAELKQQLERFQQKIAKLEHAAQPARDERNTCDTAFLADRFKYRVPFETGRSQKRNGGQIEIREVWGTRPRIEIGGQYLVRGKCTLPPGERGKLYFYATAGGPWGQTASLDLQSTTVDSQNGEFALVHGMAGPGHFHVILTAADSYSRWFADLYFGTGDNVWREQP
jgi:RNA polymerase sigma factor (sigma-70 family)